MIGLDVHRNITHDMDDVECDLSYKEFLVIDNYDELRISGDLFNNHHFEPYSSDNLIYLREMDLVYSIYDLNNGLLLRAPYKIGKDYIQSWVTPCIEFHIPQLKKILKTKGITKSTASKKIKERDNNPVSNKEKIILVSPEQDINDEWALILGGLGCRSFLVFARDAKNYMENSPRELLVMLGREAPTEYREIITADDERTLREKVELCIERMEMKHEDSFFYRHANKILTILWCITVIALIVAIVNILQVGGVI